MKRRSRASLILIIVSVACFAQPRHCACSSSNDGNMPRRSSSTEVDSEEAAATQFVEDQKAKILKLLGLKKAPTGLILPSASTDLAPANADNDANSNRSSRSSETVTSAQTSDSESQSQSEENSDTRLKRQLRMLVKRVHSAGKLKFNNLQFSFHRGVLGKRISILPGYVPLDFLGRHHYKLNKQSRQREVSSIRSIDDGCNC